ncbi:hypothetical protein LCGC14_0957460 [marine sediment metagenome]|uniref:Uncharacterized protein n=1 Tax=marine sediment metagenome TaxID=412755 RepID=A0A0F9P1I7_9ZZZZ
MEYTKEGKVMNVHDITKEVSEVLVFLEQRGLNEGERMTVLQAAAVFTQSHISSKAILLNISRMLTS